MGLDASSFAGDTALRAGTPLKNNFPDLPSVPDLDSPKKIQIKATRSFELAQIYGSPSVGSSIWNSIVEGGKTAAAVAVWATLSTVQGIRDLKNYLSREKVDRSQCIGFYKAFGIDLESATNDQLIMLNHDVAKKIDRFYESTQILSVKQKKTVDDIRKKMFTSEVLDSVKLYKIPVKIINKKNVNEVNYLTRPPMPQDKKTISEGKKHECRISNSIMRIQIVDDSKKIPNSTINKISSSATATAFTNGEPEPTAVVELKVSVQIASDKKKTTPVTFSEGKVWSAKKKKAQEVTVGVSLDELHVYNVTAQKNNDGLSRDRAINIVTAKCKFLTQDPIMEKIINDAPLKVKTHSDIKKRKKIKTSHK